MTSESTTACCKVGRAIASYDLFEFDAELRRQRERGLSLRDLAAFTNTRMLERALADAGADVVGDPDSLYRALTDAADTGTRVEVESTLDREGVDVEALRDAFVSHTTVKTHLNDCLDVATDRELSVDPEAERGTIEWARTRSERVIEESLSRLRRAGELDTGPLAVAGTVRVTCEDCGRSYRLHDLLDAGGCDCERAE